MKDEQVKVIFTSDNETITMTIANTDDGNISIDTDMGDKGSSVHDDTLRGALAMYFIDCFLQNK